MNFIETKLKGCFEAEVIPYEDSRGWFARTFCKNEFSKIGHDKEWVQLNHSYTKQKGTIRGMHYQLSPHIETKLVRCISGAVYDVVIDLRKDSLTFLQWFGTELSATNMKMIYIPDGFAHGFQTLANDCELIYHHTAFYTPGAEGGINYGDLMIKIKWPLAITDISEKDKSYPLLDANFKGI